MRIETWLHAIPRPDGTKLKIKAIMSTIFSHGVRWELVTNNPVCGQGGTPGHRGASTGVRQSGKSSIKRTVLAPDVVRQVLERLPLREATMALLDAVTALRLPNWSRSNGTALGGKPARYGRIGPWWIES